MSDLLGVRICEILQPRGQEKVRIARALIVFYPVFRACITVFYYLLLILFLCGIWKYLILRTEEFSGRRSRVFVRRHGALFDRVGTATGHQ